MVNQIQIVSSADSATTSDLLKLEMHDGNVIRVPLSELTKKLPYYLKIKDSLPENSIVDMEVGIYTTSESIEASVAADKEKAKNENKSESDAKTDEEQASQTESTEDVTATESTEAESGENQSSEASNEEQADNNQAAEQAAQQ